MKTTRKLGRRDVVVCSAAVMDDTGSAPKVAAEMSISNYKENKSRDSS